MIRLGMDSSICAAVVCGIVLMALAIGLAVVELTYYLLARRLLKGHVVRWFRKVLKSRKNTREALIAARMDGGVEAWVGRNCPGLNYEWVRDELMVMRFD